MAVIDGWFFTNLFLVYAPSYFFKLSNFTLDFIFFIVSSFFLRWKIYGVRLFSGEKENLLTTTPPFKRLSSASHAVSYLKLSQFICWAFLIFLHFFLASYSLYPTTTRIISRLIIHVTTISRLFWVFSLEMSQLLSTSMFILESLSNRILLLFLWLLTLGGIEPSPGPPD